LHSATPASRPRTSTVKSHRARPLFIVLGFTLAFAVFALIFSFFGGFLGLSPDAFRTLAAVLIGLFGLMMIFPRLQERISACLVR